MRQSFHCPLGSKNIGLEIANIGELSPVIQSGALEWVTQRVAAINETA
jgi:hypothetical protein